MIMNTSCRTLENEKREEYWRRDTEMSIMMHELYFHFQTFLLLKDQELKRVLKLDDG